jgi:hypothetical protein
LPTTPKRDKFSAFRKTEPEATRRSPKGGFLRGVGRVLAQPFKSLAGHVKNIWNAGKNAYYGESLRLLEDIFDANLAEIERLLNAFEKDISDYLTAKIGEIIELAEKPKTGIAKPDAIVDTIDAKKKKVGLPDRPVDLRPAGIAPEIIADADADADSTTAVSGADSIPKEDFQFINNGALYLGLTSTFGRTGRYPPTLTGDLLNKLSIGGKGFETADKSKYEEELIKLIKNSLVEEKKGKNVKDLLNNLLTEKKYKIKPELDMFNVPKILIALSIDSKNSEEDQRIIAPAAAAPPAAAAKKAAAKKAAVADIIEFINNKELTVPIPVNTSEEEKEKIGNTLQDKLISFFGKKQIDSIDDIVSNYYIGNNQYAIDQFNALKKIYPDITENMPDADAETKKVEADPVQPNAETKKVEADPIQTDAETKKVEADPVRPPAETEKIEAGRVQTDAETKKVEADPVQPPAEFSTEDYFNQFKDYVKKDLKEKNAPEVDDESLNNKIREFLNKYTSENDIDDSDYNEFLGSISGNNTEDDNLVKGDELQSNPEGKSGSLNKEDQQIAIKRTLGEDFDTWLNSIPENFQKDKTEIENIINNIKPETNAAEVMQTVTKLKEKIKTLKERISKPEEESEIKGDNKQPAVRTGISKNRFSDIAKNVNIENTPEPEISIKQDNVERSDKEYQEDYQKSYEKALELVKIGDRNSHDELINIMDKLENKERASVIQDAAKEGQLTIFKDFVETYSEFQTTAYLLAFASDAPLKIVKWIFDNYQYGENGSEVLNDDFKREIRKKNNYDNVDRFLLGKLPANEDDPKGQEDDPEGQEDDPEGQEDDPDGQLDAESFKRTLSKFKRLLQN